MDGIARLTLRQPVTHPDGERPFAHPAEEPRMWWSAAHGDGHNDAGRSGPISRGRLTTGEAGGPFILQQSDGEPVRFCGGNARSEWGWQRLAQSLFRLRHEIRRIHEKHAQNGPGCAPRLWGGLPVGVWGGSPSARSVS
jgi:hypothetical protein